MRLQNRFLITIIPAIVLALLSLGAMVYMQLMSTSRSNLEQDVKMAMERVNLRATAFVEAAERDAVLISDSAVVADWFVAEHYGRGEQVANQAIKSLFRKVRASQPLYREVRLLSRDGSEKIRLADADLPNTSETEAGTDWFGEVGLNWGASLHRSVTTRTDDGKPAFVVARPVRLALESTPGARARLLGYVVISVDIEALGAMVTHRAIGDEGFVSVMNADSAVIYAPRQHEAEAELVARALPQSASTGSAHEYLFELDAAGEHYSLALQPLFEGLDAVIAVPGTSATALAARIGKTVSLVTLAAIVGVAGLFYLLIRSVIVRPLTRLQNNLEALGDGRVTSTHDAERDDEIGDLTRSFHTMSKKLADSMDELQGSHLRIQNLAYEDGLTRLPNRRRFMEQITTSVNEAQYSNKHIALLFIDLNDFKRLNDLEGHRAGDRLLIEVAARLSDVVDRHERRQGASLGQGSSCVARIGGDEFVLLLDDIGSIEQAEQVAREVFASLGKPVDIGESEQLVAASAGMALFPEHANDPDTLIVSADAAMYKAKREGAGSWCMYDRSMTEESDARLKLEKDLRGAFDGQLKLQYQPQFRVDSTELWGVEALIRWEHPQRGLVSPADFISLAEETGLIVEVGNWVIDEACRQWVEWDRAGIAPERVAVNVSQRQFALSDVAAEVESVLEKYNMPPAALELEITESCMMDTSVDVIATLCELRARGIHVAMDDFGTGHSSLGALNKLPIDTIKVDRCFVSGLEAGMTNDTIVAAVLMLAENLNLTVVAEGVETEAELARLRWHGCDVGQGFLLARPMWAMDATALLQDRHDDEEQLLDAA